MSSSLPIKTGSGGTANIATVTLSDGVTQALGHVTLNPDGSVVSPAQDATLQAATTALQTLVTTLTGYVETDPGTF